jgi:hypothetical protein
LSASKPDLIWLTIINVEVGNGDRVVVNWPNRGRMRLLSHGLWQGLSLDGGEKKLVVTSRTDVIYCDTWYRLLKHTLIIALYGSST